MDIEYNEEVIVRFDGKKYRLLCTGAGCPEQYDVFLDNQEVGYLRLRHGSFTASLGVGGVVVYSANPEGDGWFNDDEREFFLYEAVQAIHECRDQ